MLDVTPLVAAVDHLADRLRSAPQSRLQRGLADEGLSLARELALRAQRIEFPGREPLAMPEVGMFAVADQVAVAGHDLAEALRSAVGSAGSGGVPEASAGRPESAGAELADAVALVEAATKRCGL
ncbi:hypothetical protein ABZW18_16570 [Streptomyces sp. NPDC004647]|uniref:hypothetical protein n=1 Tax=Streptomyces sp. NPDC004647 TaxID=3154671 RepID=UPI0033A91A60